MLSTGAFAKHAVVSKPFDAQAKGELFNKQDDAHPLNAGGKSTPSVERRLVAGVLGV